MTFTIAKTRDGYVATHVETGRVVAHSPSRALLDAYLRSCSP